MVKHGIAKSNDSILRIAVMRGRIDMVRRLLNFNAVQENVCVNAGYSSGLAYQNNHVDVADYLLQYEKQTYTTLTFTQTKSSSSSAPKSVLESEFENLTLDASNESSSSNALRKKF